MERILEDIGLTPTEAKVYLALLDLGEAKTGEILKKANLNSGRIYEILASLQKKGLVSFIVKKNVKLFIPSPPDRIHDYLNEQINELEIKKKSFQKDLPELMKKYKTLKEKTSVEVFFGAKGQKTAYSIFFKEAKKDKELYVTGIVAKEKYEKELLDILVYYVYKERIRLGLKTYKLASEESRKDKIFRKDNSKIRYLPYPSMTSMQMLGDITLITMEREPIITILIYNKKLTQDYKEQFKFLWDIAKK